jgi:hypothetical protein
VPVLYASLRSLVLDAARRKAHQFNDSAVGGSRGGLARQRIDVLLVLDLVHEVAPRAHLEQVAQREASQRRLVARHAKQRHGLVDDLHPAARAQAHAPKGISLHRCAATRAPRSPRVGDRRRRVRIGVEAHGHVLAHDLEAFAVALLLLEHGHLGLHVRMRARHKSRACAVRVWRGGGARTRMSDVTTMEPCGVSLRSSSSLLL